MGAFVYMKTAYALLPKDSWESHYALSLDICFQLAQGIYASCFNCSAWSARFLLNFTVLSLHVLLNSCICLWQNRSCKGLAQPNSQKGKVP